MTSKLPSTNRRPAGLNEAAEVAILAKAGDITADGVKAVFEKEGHPDAAAAEAWLADHAGLDVRHVWWVLERRDAEARTNAALGINPEEQNVNDPKKQAQAELRGRYVYSAFRHQFWNRKVRDWIDPKALEEVEGHRMPLGHDGEPMSAVRLFRMDSRAQRVHNERFMPGSEEEIVSADGGEWLNTWRPSEIKPAAGDASWMLDHILYLCNGDKTIADQLLDWMAFTAQNPGVKINYAPLLISPAQGVGKDTICIALARVVGYENAYFLDDGAIAEGRFDFMKSSSLVVVPEVMCGERREVANKLKPLITQEVIRVNEKNVKPYRVINHANFMMLSNYENAAFIEDEDRRYFVIICRQKPKSPDYFTDFYGKIWGDEISAFAHVLMTRDLSNFNPKAPAPHTEHKDTVRNATQNGVEAWLEDAWQSGAVPFDKDVINARDALKAAQDAGAPRQMSVQAITSFLKKERIGGGDLGKPRINVDTVIKQVRLWAVRDMDEISKAPVEVIGLAYGGMPWRRAALEIQKPRHMRNSFTNSEVEKAIAAAE